MLSDMGYIRLVLASRRECISSKSSQKPAGHQRSRFKRPHQPSHKIDMSLYNIYNAPIISPCEERWGFPKFDHDAEHAYGHRMDRKAIKEVREKAMEELYRKTQCGDLGRLCSATTSSESTPPEKRSDRQRADSAVGLSSPTFLLQDIPTASFLDRSSARTGGTDAAVDYQVSIAEGIETRNPAANSRTQSEVIFTKKEENEKSTDDEVEISSSESIIAEGDDMDAVIKGDESATLSFKEMAIVLKNIVRAWGLEKASGIDFPFLL